jgi:hypothetical protein
MLAVHTKNWGSQKPTLGSQLNCGHPLAQGLVGCWLMNEGGGNKLADLISGYFASGQTATIPWKFKNISLDGSTSKNIQQTQKPMLVNLAKLSIFTGAYITGGNESMLVNLGNGSGWRFTVHASTRNLRFQVDFDNTDLSVTNNTSQPANTWLNYSVTYSGGLAVESSKMYVNARLAPNQSTATGVGKRIDDSASALTIGEDGAGGNILKGMMKYLYIYNRVLSPSEITSLYIAPYQMIQAPRYRFYSIPAGVTSQILKVGGVELVSIGKVGSVDKASISKVGGMVN